MNGDSLIETRPSALVVQISRTCDGVSLDTSAGCIATCGKSQTRPISLEGAGEINWSPDLERLQLRCTDPNHRPLFLYRLRDSVLVLTNRQQHLGGLGAGFSSEAILQSLALGYFHPNASLYTDSIRLLPRISYTFRFPCSATKFQQDAEHSLLFHLKRQYGVISRHRSQAQGRKLDPEAACRELVNELAEATTRRTMQAITPALFLSSGHDSVLLAKIIARSGLASRFTAYNLRSPFISRDESPQVKLLARHFGIPLKVVTATGNDMIDAAQRIRQADTIAYDLGCFGATILSSAARYNDVLVSGSGIGGAFRSSRWFHDARHLLQSRQYRLVGGFALLSRALLNREYATALHMPRRRAWKYPLSEIYSRYKINRFDDSVNCRDDLTPVLRGLDKYRDAEIFTVIDRVLVAELYLANKYRELSAQGRSTFLPYTEAPVCEVFDRVARQNGGYDLLVGKGLSAMALEEERRKGLLAARKLALAVEIGPLLTTMDEAGLLSTRRLQDAYRHLYRTRESLDQLYRRSGLDARKRQKVVYSLGLLNLWNKDAFEVALRHESPRVSDSP